MSRAPFQVLVLPFRHSQGGYLEYAIFRRRDGEYWQFIAGGGENNEKPLESARREALEEAGIPPESDITALDSCNTVPVVGVTGEFTWGENVYVIPEYTFGANFDSGAITLSMEHTEYRWVSYQDALTMLKWDSNKNTLWELNARLAGQTEP
ncbi:MAG: NUDIX pyrophosphatase [Dehalococcoidales bacterium]|nr:MAG: NUDIX pyrophosphatase [Dehalococcoidales bacterium]